MEQRKLAFILESLAHRVRDFPDAAVGDLFEALHDIEKKYDLDEPLTEDDRRAIERSRADIEAGRVVTHEELKAKWPHLFRKRDRDADGKRVLHEVVERAQKQPGELQGGLANIILAVLNETLY